LWDDILNNCLNVFRPPTSGQTFPLISHFFVLFWWAASVGSFYGKKYAVSFSSDILIALVSINLCLLFQQHWINIPPAEWNLTQSDVYGTSQSSLVRRLKYSPQPISLTKLNNNNYIESILCIIKFLHLPLLNAIWLWSQNINLNTSGKKFKNKNKQTNKQNIYKLPSNQIIFTKQWHNDDAKHSFIQ
jgi:hypothetical protein